MISGIISLILLIAFIIGTFWVYSSKRHQEFNRAAAIPLENDDNEDEVIS
jgi:cytochrome c oxidase cbb3-type subunit IV